MPKQPQLMPMNEEQYAIHWEQESLHLDNQGIYRKLFEIVPTGNVIEVGCGAGFATQYLASNRRVLSIDNNRHLLAKTRRRLQKIIHNVELLQADLLNLSQGNLRHIANFSPSGIICWFIGSNPENINRHTPGLPLNEQGKKYREKIEDAVVSQNFCPQSVEWIHFVQRTLVLDTATEHEIFKSTKDDYDTHVFAPAGFEVADVAAFSWNRDGSNFLYSSAPNPNLQAGRPIPIVISVVARRRSQMQTIE